MTALAAGLLFLCHLQNFLFGVGAALVLVVFADATMRRRLWGVAALVPAAGALVLWHRHGWLAGGSADRRNSPVYAYKALIWARRADRAGAPMLRDLGHRLAEVPDHALRGFTDGIDVRATWTLLFVVAFYFALGIAGRWVRSAEDEPSPAVGIAAWVIFLGALFAYLALPHHLLDFDIATLAPRFVPLALAMLLVAIPAGLARYPGAARWLLPLPAFVFARFTVGSWSSTTGVTPTRPRTFARWSPRRSRASGRWVCRSTASRA